MTGVQATSDLAFARSAAWQPDGREMPMRTRALLLARRTGADLRAGLGAGE